MNDSTMTSQPNVFYSGPGRLEFIKIGICVFLGILTIFFNFFVFAVLKRGRDIFDDITVLLFRSMALVDIITGLVVSIMEGVLFYLDGFPYSSTVCSFIPAMSFLMIANAIDHVCLINLQRYVSITYPFWYIRNVTVRRVRIVLVVMKMFILLGIFPVSLPFPGFPLELYANGICEIRSIRLAFDIKMNAAIIATLVLACFVFFVPIVLMTFVNMRLLVLAYRINKKKIVLQLRPKSGDTDPEKSNENVPTNRNNNDRPRLKGLRTVFVITFLFYISITPLAFMVCVMVLQPPWSIEIYDNGAFVAIVVIICSCWWNVPVYMCTSATFRQGSKALLTKRFQQATLLFRKRARDINVTAATTSAHVEA